MVERVKSNKLPTSGTPNPAAMAKQSVPQIVRAIKSHVEKGDKATERAQEYYKNAGFLILELKKRFPKKWAQKSGLGRSRAHQLIAIAEGRSSLAELRADYAESNRRRQEKISMLHGNARDAVAACPVASIGHARPAEVVNLDDHRAPKAPLVTPEEKQRLFRERLPEVTTKAVVSDVPGDYESAQSDFERDLQQHRHYLPADVVELFEAALRRLTEYIAETNKAPTETLQ
jgi:hypothetical protein